MNKLVQDDCGCVYVVGEQQGRIPAFRCPVHGGDEIDAERSLWASNAVSILPWDAIQFFHSMLERLNRQLPESPLDLPFLSEIYESVKATISQVGSLDHIFAMLVRSNILTVTNDTWRFTHRWQYDPETNDFIRRDAGAG